MVICKCSVTVHFLNKVLLEFFCPISDISVEMLLEDSLLVENGSVLTFRTYTIKNTCVRNFSLKQLEYCYNLSYI